jgi:RNA polymerase subunit RPABC4/transcription elongation factor Spt4
MIHKTVKGKRCPVCSSFMEDRAVQCRVCGYKPGGKEDDPLGIPGIPTGEKGVIKCSKCGSVNRNDFKFCKICKHPLKTEERDRVIPQEGIETISKGSSSELFLRFDWITVPPGYQEEKQLRFVNFSPFFDGYLQWKEYVFFVYRHLAQYEMLTRKIKRANESKLYKKCKNILIGKSGNEFYIGAVKLQLLGEAHEKEELKTIVKPTGTFFVGPGEEINGNVKTGPPGLKVLNLSPGKEFIETREKVLIGRHFLADQWKINEDTLRKNGVSKEHMYITPLKDGDWLMEPIPGKPVFTEIGEIPQILEAGDTLRWVSTDRVGEFKIYINTLEA